MDSFEVDTVVVGAGVVGLAVARALAMAGHEVLILEKNPVFGEETSARNSEVIHAGLYYPEGSLKARHCVRGREMLYQFCREAGVAHRNCGKLIVAGDATDCAALPQIAAHAAANGVTDLQHLQSADIARLEPHLRAQEALLSPSSGIVDSHAFMLAMLGQAEDAGAQLVTRASIDSGTLTASGAVDLTIGGAEPMRLRARSLVNCAGLWAGPLAARIHGMPPPPEVRLVKGNYFSYSARVPFSRLVYPVPQDGGLGIHLTLDMAGRARFGPDTEWLASDNPEDIDYTVEDSRRSGFAEAIHRYWPEMDAARLQADYSGVRPKVAGAVYPDFMILGPDALGGPHVAMFGMESPGLTGALSIAQDVVGMIGAR
jgi:L-2-hydroxyglutarate oxidase LhgO